MITRDEAKKLADETIKLADEMISSILLQTALSQDFKGFSEVGALCYAFSALIMQRAFPKVDLADDSFEIAVAAQCTTLACAIDAGALSKQYIYDSYVNLVQEANEKTDD